MQPGRHPGGRRRRVIARAGTAKMTLYRNFPSKDDLILDFLRRREQLWTREWLEAASAGGPRARAASGHIRRLFRMVQPAGLRRLRVPHHDDRSQRPRAPGPSGRGRAPGQYPGYIERLAAEASIREAGPFARKWHILMKGSIMAAHEGDAEAAARARQIGELLLAQYEAEAADPPRPVS